MRCPAGTLLTAVAASVLIGGAFAGPPAGAQPAVPSPLEKRAFERHMSDLTTCLAYYSIAQVGLRKSGRDEPAQKIDAVKSTLLDRTFIVMEVTGMAQDTVLDRQRAAMSEQMTLIGNDLQQLSVLTERYGEFCKSVVEEPEARVDHWKRELRGTPAD